MSYSMFQALAPRNQAPSPVDLAEPSTSPPPEIGDPRLPLELMIKIFNHAQEQDICLTALLRTTKLNYSLVWPMIYKDNTLHLNRETLPGLATFMCNDLIGKKKDTPARKKESDPENLGIFERRTRLLESITTLVINDVRVMFEWDWSLDFIDFCSSVVLPNVTKIIWREDKLQEGCWAGPYMIPSLKGREWITPPRGVDNAAVDAELQNRRPKQFIPVLPAKVKEVCIIVPASGYFQAVYNQYPYPDEEHPWSQSFLTIERINKFVARFTGDVTVRVHQPVSKSDITLSDASNTIYSFYADYWNVPARPRLIEAFARTVARRLQFDQVDSNIWEDMSPDLAQIVQNGAYNREEMLEQCKRVIEQPQWQLYNGHDREDRRDLRTWIMGLVTAMINLIYSDHNEVECPCCGTVGTSLNAYRPQAHI